MPDYTETQLAWFCGIFEGEGCVQHKPNGRGGASFTRELTIQMTDVDILERIVEYVGGAISGPYLRTNCKPQYCWRLARWGELCPLALEMIPYMGERRKLALERLLANPPAYWYEDCDGKRCKVVS